MVLAFQTNSFRQERGSVLHPGIYNRETASILASAACVVLIGFFFAPRAAPSHVHFPAGLILFLLLFLFFRTYVFIDSILRVVIDKRNNTVVIGRRIFPLQELVSVLEENKEIAPENPDGVKVAGKIALQHGTVIPGFGETFRFRTVVLKFRYSDSMVIFSSGDYSETANVTNLFRNFMER